MKNCILILTFLFFCTTAIAQHAEAVDKLVNEGIAFHDKGNYEEAIASYDKALALDMDNLYALSEKALSLLSLTKYEETIIICQKLIKKYPGDKGLKMVYVSYGNSLDALKKPDNSIEIYEEGIKEFPDYYYLHFNKGITLYGEKRWDDAILCFQKSAMLNPGHASTHNAIARLMAIKDKRIPAVLALCTFLTIEPEGERAKGNLDLLLKTLEGNSEKTGKNSRTITIDVGMLGDTTSDGKPRENSFSETDVLLSLVAGMEDTKLTGKSAVEKFYRKMEMLSGSLKETRKDNYGFYWDYYVPYFTEMNDKGLTEAFAYIAFASMEDPKVKKWVKSHEDEVEKLYAWANNFAWKDH
jgi:Tfp pilus assembly protein PilF